LFRYLGMTTTYQNLIHEEDYIRAMLGTIQFRIFCLCLMSINLKIRIYRTIILPVILYV
jgi:hypothetical protein